MKHTDTISSVHVLLHWTAWLAVIALACTVAAPPALSQPEQIEDTFDSSYPNTSSLGVWDQGNTQELCFEVSTVIDGFQVACTNGSTVEQVSGLGPNGSNISELTSFQGDLYFSATEDAAGDEVYRYDGTSVTRITSLEAASGNAFPEDLVVYDNALYFTATGSEGDEIYRYTGSQVERATDFAESTINPRDLTLHDGDLYFVAQQPSSLFSFDGTSLDKKDDIRRDGVDPSIRGLASYNGNLYFSADAGTGNGQQLIQYDGSSYSELFISTPDGDDKSPRDLTVYDGDLYYSANTTEGREVFRFSTDFGPNESEITQFDTPNSDPQNITGYGDDIYFSAKDGTNGRELYSLGTDFTYSSTRIDLRPGAEDSEPEGFTVHDGDLYFYAETSDARSDDDLLHRYDGSSVTLVRSANNFAFDGAGTFGANKTVYDGDIYFSRTGPTVGWELFRSDGSTVELVEDLASGTDGSLIGDLVRYDGALYFRAATPSTGSELYVYDGSSIRLAADIVSGSDGSIPYALTVYNGFLYFSAADANQDRELYRYSSQAGAQRVENINGSGSAFDVFQSPTDFQVYDGDLYFKAKTDAAGYELFRTSGLSATRVTDINSGSADAFPDGLTVYDGVLYFRADNGSDGNELYGYNAGSGAVRQVESLNPSGDGLPPRPQMAVYDGTLYFVGNDGNTGRELFQYDGFSISLVQDIASGDTDSNPRDFAIYNSRLYFTASTPDRGREPYSFDGQTVRSTEVVTGPVSGGGIDPVVYDDGSGSRLFVTATDNVTGIELYAFSESDGPLPVELAQFDASTDGEAVRLAWKTTSETGNAGFAVQRRPGDENAWTALSFVGGSGTTNQTQTYRFEDTSLPFAADSLQYRLKQVDADGTTHFSDPVVIARGAVDEAALRSVYPRPATNRATVELAVPTGAQDARLEVFDLLGRSVRTVATGMTSGRQTHTVRVSDLSPGVYFLRLRAAGTTTTKKLTVVQ